MFGFYAPNPRILFLFTIFRVTPGSSKGYFMLFVPLISVNFAFIVQSVKLTRTKEPLFFLIRRYSDRSGLAGLDPPS